MHGCTFQFRVYIVIICCCELIYTMYCAMYYWSMSVTKRYLKKPIEESGKKFLVSTSLEPGDLHVFIVVFTRINQSVTLNTQLSRLRSPPQCQIDSDLRPLAGRTDSPSWSGVVAGRLMPRRDRSNSHPVVRLASAFLKQIASRPF